MPDYGGNLPNPAKKTSQPLLLAINLIFLVGSLFPPFIGAQQVSNQKDNPPHHREDGFDNPYLERNNHGFFKYFKMRYFSDEKYADYESNSDKVPTMPADRHRIDNPAAGDLQVTWIGHATVLIQYRGQNILTDPMFSARASPLSFYGPRRYHPPALAINNLPKIDYVVLSHNHYDHLDVKTVQKLGSGPIWLVPLGLKEWFINAGIRQERVMELDWWDNRQFGQVKITAAPAQHWSARTFWDRKQTLWASWLIEIDDRTIWYSGDTGYNPYQFKEIGAKTPKIDLALISIGAYEPRWFMKDVHINPPEAVKIHDDINSQYSLGIQWGTFQLTAEPIDDPPLKLKEALIKNNLPLASFETIKIGETRRIKK